MVNLYTNNNVDNLNTEIDDDVVRKLPSLPPLKTSSINSRILNNSTSTASTSSEQYASPDNSLYEDSIEIIPVTKSNYGIPKISRRTPSPDHQTSQRLYETPSTKSSVSVLKPSRGTLGQRPKPPQAGVPLTPSPSSRTPTTPSHSSNARKFQAPYLNDEGGSSPTLGLKTNQPLRSAKFSYKTEQRSQEILPPRPESLASSLENVSPALITEMGVHTSEFIDFVHGSIKISQETAASSNSESMGNSMSRNSKPMYPLSMLQKPRPPLPVREISSNPSVGSNPDIIQSHYSSSAYTFSQTSPTIKTASNSEQRNTSVNSVLGNRPLPTVGSVTIPTNPFSIDLIDEEKLQQCSNVHNLSSIYEWLLKVYFEWFSNYIFYKLDFFELVQLLVEFKLSFVSNQDTIDSNVDRIIESLILQNAVRFEYDLQPTSSKTKVIDDELTIVSSGIDVCGVFTGITVCQSCADKHARGQCYSYICRLAGSLAQSKSLDSSPCKKVQPKGSLTKDGIFKNSIGAWSEYWNLSSEDLNEINPREIKRQSFIFDLIILEERCLNLANAAVHIYGQNFSADLLPNDPNFYQLGFDIFNPLIDLHTNYLLAPLYAKLETKGKFIDGVGKIYLKWVHEAVTLYVRYSENMAVVNEIINWEKQQPNSRFSAWLKYMDNSPEISRCKIYHDVIFFGGFFKSLQNMPITLNSILKNTDKSSDDYNYLSMAIKEIEHLNSLVDTTMGEFSDRRRIIRLSKQLVVSRNVGFVSKNSPTGANSPSNDGSDFVDINDKFDLRLNEKSRMMIKEGKLWKKRDLWMEPTLVCVFLLDNYLLITEIVKKNGETKYKLVERPIPIAYLSLETRDHEIETPTSATSRPSLQHTPSGALVFSLQQSRHFSDGSPHILRALTRSNGSDKSYEINNQTEQFSFKVRNTATNESYTLLSHSYEEHAAWLASIVNVFKTYNTDKNTSQVFKLECLNDLFSFHDKDAPVTLPVTVEGSAIDLALKNHYAKGLVLHEGGIKSNILCSIKFKYESKTFILCAVTYGIYMTDISGQTLNKHDNWKLVAKIEKVVKMEASVQMDILFVLFDRKLVYFSLPSIVLAYYNSAKYLDKNELVGIFVNEKVTSFFLAENFENSRQLVYERKGFMYFMTPEYDRINKVVNYFKFFKAYKVNSSSKLSISSEVEDVNIFTKSFIVCLADKGFVLFNDSFNDEGLSLPVFPNDLNFIHMPGASRHGKGTNEDTVQDSMIMCVIKDIVAHKTKPISCFKLKNGDFILVYDEAVVMMNKNGYVAHGQQDILVLDFYCNNCSMNSEFLILCGENLIQVYDFSSDNIEATSLNKLTPVQIITGKRIKLISCQKEEDTVISLSHPWISGRQLVLGFYQ